MTTPATVDDAREQYLAAARAYYERVTAESSRRRAAADHAARRVGVSDIRVREWDAEAAHSVLGEGFPRV